MLRALLVVVCALALSAPAAGDPAVTVRVIVHAKNAAAKLDKHFVVDVFLKKRTRWDDDRAAQPVDLGQASSVREKFTKDVLGRDVAAVRRYWAQQTFSGHGVPPPELASDADVVKYVAAHEGAIGYVSGQAELSGVKVVELE